MRARLWCVILGFGFWACGASPGPPDWPALQAVPAPEGGGSGEALVSLGHHLFYDPGLSVNGFRSCAVCHEQKKAFTDGFPQAIGATQQVHPRNSPTLTNVAYRAALNWRDPRATHLEDQLLVPLLGTAPVEMGMAGMESVLLARLQAETRYLALFAAAFTGEDNPISMHNIARAIAAFERTLLSADSAFDRHRSGQAGALSESAREGMDLFFSARAGCAACHSGPDLDRPAESPQGPPGYHNVGLYNVDGQGAYPAGNQGLMEITGVASDMGRFRTPTLRNVALTGPYFHDGSVVTLGEVIRIHLQGGRLVTQGPRQGDGRTSPLRDAHLAPRTLSDREKWTLEVFLRALTDDAFITNPKFSDPWPSARL